MREMRQPAHFASRALLAANAIMVVCYTGTSALGYATHGAAVTPFLPDALPAGPQRSFVGLLLAFHTMVAYLLTGQPLHRTVHMLLRPSTVDAGGPRAALHWAAISLAFLAFSFLVGNLVPFFADFQDVLGNLVGASTVFGWPAALYLRGKVLRSHTLSWSDCLLCGTFLLVFVPAFTVLGTYRAIAKIFADWAEEGSLPFQCIRGGS